MSNQNKTEDWEKEYWNFWGGQLEDTPMAKEIYSFIKDEKKKEEEESKEILDMQLNNAFESCKEKIVNLKKEEGDYWSHYLVWKLGQEKETLIAKIDKVYKKEQGIHNWLDLREKLLKEL